MSVHYVYRVWDVDQRLIYVGCTKDLFGRLRTHQYNSWWAYQAASVKAEVHPDKWAGLAAERCAIESGRPRWNLFCRGDRKFWTADEYHDYVTASLNLSEPMTPSRLKRLQNLVRHYEFRFGEQFPIQLPGEVA